MITVGIILFIRTLPETIQLRGLHSRLPGSSGKLYTSHRSRENHCRQSQYLRTPKMRDLRVHHVLGRHVSHAFLTLIALVEHYFAKELMAVPFSMLYLPAHGDIPPDDDYCRLRDRFPTHLTLHVPVLATLQTATAETFMTFRAFQPMLTFGLEAWIAVYSIDLRPDLDTRDYILACIIILGSLLILIMPPKRVEENRSKQYMTD